MFVRTHRVGSTPTVRRAVLGAALAALALGTHALRAEGPKTPAAQPAGIPAKSPAPDDKAASLGQVFVDLVDLRNEKGQVLSLLFRSKDGYPDNVQKAFARAKSRIQQRRAQLVFNAVPAGPFAVVVFHDENESMKMDKGLFGVPLEGYGVSRNVKVTMSGPNFDATKLTLGPGQRLRIAIRLKY